MVRLPDDDTGFEPSNMDGKGTKESPYIITNVKELQSVNHALTCIFELGCDIDASETSEWNDGKGFNPIGKTEHQGGQPFTGFIDGNGYSIENIFINRPKRHNTGLFGVLNEDAIITNIKLKNARIQGNFAVGSMVGYNAHGNIVESEIYDVKVVGEKVVGGFIGWNQDPSGLIKVKSTNTLIRGDDSVGGIVGDNSGYVITVDMSEDTCSVGESNIGNLCGENQGYIKPDQ